MTAYQDFQGRKIMNLTGHAICFPQKKDLSFILDGSAAQPTFAPDITLHSQGRLCFISSLTKRTPSDSPAACGIRMTHSSQFTDLTLCMDQSLEHFVPHPMFVYIVPGDVAAMLLLKGSTKTISAANLDAPPAEFAIAVPVDVELPQVVGGPLRAKSLQFYDVKQ